MKIIIVGAGDVGHYLCQVLSEEGHAVTLIESNAERADEIEEHVDARIIRGNGASAKFLSMAGVADCDYLVAMTAFDQLNIVACAIGKTLGAKTTIARVHDQIYGDNSLFNYQKNFGIDILINPEALTAVELAKHVRNPERMAIEEFARGQIELQEVEISDSAKYVGTPLKEMRLDPSIRIGYVQRADVLYVPTADTILKPRDKVTIIGTPEAILKYRGYFSAEKSADAVRVVLNGATETAVSIIKRLSNYRFKIRVIDPDLERCKELAEQFPNVTVINGSATSLRLMEEEQIGNADYFIACTKDDEENVMTCLQAKKLGVKYVELVINKTDYEQVLQNIGSFLNITADASPRRVTVSEIKKYITDKNFTIIGALKGGVIEFIELKVSEKSSAVGSTLREVKLPTGAIVAAIVNDNSAKVPAANDIIQSGDKLIVILEKDKISDVAKIFVR